MNATASGWASSKSLALHYAGAAAEVRNPAMSRGWQASIW
jgi:hypothetical protein